MKRVLLILVVAGFAQSSFAQLDNTVFEDRMKIDEADSGKLFLGLNFLGFGKNNEYFNTIIEGYTLLGYQFNPYASYHISKHIRLDGGVYLQKDFGNADFSTVAPTLSLKIQQGHFAFIFGNLESSLNHRLIEPLYDFERVLNNRLETGVQMQIMKDDLFLDLWVDWQNMIYNRDPNQERFVSGLSVNKRVINSGVKVYVPLQLMAGHRGGQINIGSPPLETLMNSAVGLEVVRETSGLIKSWRANGYYTYYKNLSTNNERPYKDGAGMYYNANVSTKFGLDVMATYWQGHEFQAIQGGKVYPSVSVYNPLVQRETMQLLILRFLYNRKLMDGFYATFRVEPYYDFGFESFQYAYGIYFQFRDRFFLTRRK